MEGGVGSHSMKQLAGGGHSTKNSFIVLLFEHE